MSEEMKAELDIEDEKLIKNIEENFKRIENLCSSYITQYQYFFETEDEIEAMIKDVKRALMKKNIHDYDERLNNIEKYFEKLKTLTETKYPIQLSLVDERLKIYKDIVYTLVMTAFTTFKEKTIPKNCAMSNKKIYFNYADNLNLVPHMKSFYNSIIDLEYDIGIEEDSKGYHLSTEIENLDLNENEDNIKEIIWVINKIRDSFIHNKYTIDKENELFIIDNDTMNEKSNRYKLKGKISLDSLCELLENLINNKQFEEVDLFKESYVYLKFGKYGTPSFIIAPKETINNIMNHTQKENVISNDKYDPVERTAFYDKPIFNGLEIKDRKDFLASVREISEKEEKERLQATKLINVIASIWDEEPSKEILSAAYLYNYMRQIFSDIDNQNLVLNDFSMDGIDIESISDNRSIKDKKDKIKNDMINLIDNINNILKIKDEKCIYDVELGNLHYMVLQKISCIINKYYIIFDKDYSELNKDYVRLIRNGVEHGNFKYHDNKIIITDKENQRDSKSVKGIFTASIERWFDFSNEVLSKEKTIKQLIPSYNLNKFRGIVSDNIINQVELYISYFIEKEDVKVLKK